jgi:hypothetical protein
MRVFSVCSVSCWCVGSIRLCVHAASGNLPRKTFLHKQTKTPQSSQCPCSNDLCPLISNHSLSILEGLINHVLVY